MNENTKTVSDKYDLEIYQASEKLKQISNRPQQTLNEHDRKEIQRYPCIKNNQ
jgi:hypothetical protein